jgi:broad specificity phosphatase PhoE
MKIILLRHGKPSFELKGIVRGKDLRDIAKSYETSGIVGTPPKATLDITQGNHFIVCSHLTRSVESAKALGFKQAHAKESLFSETALPHFARGSIPLPISVWIVVLRLLWLLGFSKNGESLASARLRSKHATARLIALAEEHQSVLLVGHGFMNHFIAKELKKHAWLGPSKPDRRYWGYAIYERATT